MKVVCAASQSEGKPGYLGEREPYDNPATTHGLCARHKQQALEGFTRAIVSGCRDAHRGAPERHCSTEDEPGSPATEWLVQPGQSLVLFAVVRQRA
jgi:hypothetical protein